MPFFTSPLHIHWRIFPVLALLMLGWGVSAEASCGDYLSVDHQWSNSQQRAGQEFRFQARDDYEHGVGGDFFPWQQSRRRCSGPACEQSSLPFADQTLATNPVRYHSNPMAIVEDSMATARDRFEWTRTVTSRAVVRLRHDTLLRPPMGLVAGLVAA